MQVLHSIHIEMNQMYGSWKEFSKPSQPSNIFEKSETLSFIEHFI